MKLYEIDRELERMIEEGTDPDTGEILIDPGQLEALAMERDRKLEGLALIYKNTAAEAAAVKTEADSLAKRAKAIRMRAERLRDYLANCLHGQRFSSPRVTCSWRNSAGVDVETEKFIPWAKKFSPWLLRWKDPEPDKIAIQAALRSGADLPGAAIVSKSSVVIK